MFSRHRAAHIKRPLIAEMQSFIADHLTDHQPGSIRMAKLPVDWVRNSSKRRRNDLALNLYAADFPHCFFSRSCFSSSSL